MEPLIYVTLAPFATTLMVVVGVVAWGRRKAPGGWGLFAFTVSGIGWLLVDALSLLAPTDAVAIQLAQATCVFGPLLGVSWLAFILSYTGRLSRTGRWTIAGLTGWSLVYGAMAMTNDAHRLVWVAWHVVADGSLSRVAYTLGPLGWAQTLTAWTGVTVSLGALLRAYAGTGARTRDLSRWIVAGAVVPMALNVAFLVGLGPLEKDFTPIAMALSSAAFAVGLARYQFLDLRPMARAALVDNLREGMLVLDARGYVVDVNPALQQALGASAAVLGRPLRETSPVLAQAIETTPDATVRLGEGADVRYVDLRISPLADRSGTPSGSLVLLHDVTLRRQERAALHRANAALYHANTELQARNDELDAFAHTVAHDLKNSIQGVMGHAEILRDDGPGLPSDLLRELAGDVVGAAQKMGSIVHELLLLAGVRQATVDLRPVAMGAVVANALGRVRQVAAFALPACPDDWPVARGHAPWVEEIWVNYFTNAAKYGGPTVTLGAETTASGHARFWVHDDGPGLSADAQARLFIPFSRVGSLAVEGHGLGLSIVRRIVERLGGTCGVESEPGRGTRFWFALPRAPVEALLDAQASPKPSGRRSVVSSVA